MSIPWMRFLWILSPMKEFIKKAVEPWRRRFAEEFMRR